MGKTQAGKIGVGNARDYLADWVARIFLPQPAFLLIMGPALVISSIHPDFAFR
jgi:hypothetical protein